MGRCYEGGSVKSMSVSAQIGMNDALLFHFISIFSSNPLYSLLSSNRCLTPDMWCLWVAVPMEEDTITILTLLFVVLTALFPLIFTSQVCYWCKH